MLPKSCPTFKLSEQISWNSFLKEDAVLMLVESHEKLMQEKESEVQDLKKRNEILEEFVKKQQVCFKFEVFKKNKYLEKENKELKEYIQKLADKIEYDEDKELLELINLKLGKK
jgi:hypothetical protein